MAVETKTFSAASCSWIDSATGLPEVDVVPIIGPSLPRAFVTGSQGFRFCNFAEASVTADFGARRLIAQSFTPASGIYRGPSFAHIPSHAFPIFRDIEFEVDAIRFTQTLGARTVSPEVLGAGGGIVGGAIAGGIVGSFIPVVGTAVGAVVGGIVGGLTGEAVGHTQIGFPPIWSKLQIRIFRDGRMQAELLQHSLFPSLTFFRLTFDAAGNPADYDRVDHPNGSPYYNATKGVELPDWQANGWGAQHKSTSPGPTAGNPWGIPRGLTGGAEIIPN
jgi:hypothetical protein